MNKEPRNDLEFYANTLFLSPPSQTPLRTNSQTIRNSQQFERDFFRASLFCCSYFDWRTFFFFFKKISLNFLAPDKGFLFFSDSVMSTYGKDAEIFLRGLVHISPPMANKALVQIHEGWRGGGERA